MVRQRKSHTRLKKGSAALAEAAREVTGAEGHPEEGKCYAFARESAFVLLTQLVWYAVYLEGDCTPCSPHFMHLPCNIRVLLHLTK